MRRQKLSSENKNNSRNQQKIGRPIQNMNEFMINPFTLKTYKSVQSRIQLDSSLNSTPIADLQSHLLNLWTSYSVDETYQNLFLVYIETFGSRKEQAKEIEKEIKKTYEKSSLYFLLQENIVLRTQIKHEIQQKVSKENQKSTSRKSSQKFQFLLKQLCDKLKNLRRINLIIAENIIKIFEDFKVTRESNLGSIGTKYIEIFHQIDQQNDFIKESFLKEFILFQKGYDPFFLVHYEEIMKSANPKTLKKHQPVSQLFDMNISYVYRLMRAQQKMLKYMLLLDDQTGTEKERKQIINRQRMMKINTSNTSKQKKLPQSRHSNIFLPSIHRNDRQTLTQNPSVLSTIKPDVALKSRKSYHLRTPDSSNHLEDSQCSQCVRKKAFSLRPFESKETHNSLGNNNRSEYYPQKNQQRNHSLQALKNPLFHDSYKTGSTKNFQTQEDETILKRRPNCLSTYGDGTQFQVQDDQIQRSKPFGSSQSQRKWNLKHALKDRRHYLRPIKTRQTQQDNIIQEGQSQNSDQQNYSQPKKSHPIRSRLKKSKLADSEIEESSKSKPYRLSKKIESEKQKKKQKDQRQQKSSKNQKIQDLNSDSDQHNDIGKKKQSKNKEDRSKYENKSQNERNSKQKKKLKEKSNRNLKQKQKYNQNSNKKQKSQQKDRKNKKNYSSNDSKQEKQRKKSESSSHSFSNTQKSRKSSQNQFNKERKKNSKNNKTSSQSSSSSTLLEKSRKSDSSFRSNSKSSQQSEKNHKKQQQKHKNKNNLQLRENNVFEKERTKQLKQDDKQKKRKQKQKDRKRKVYNNEKAKNIQMEDPLKNREQQYQTDQINQKNIKTGQKQGNNEKLQNISNPKEEINPQKKGQRLIEFEMSKPIMNDSNPNNQLKKSDSNKFEKENFQNEVNQKTLDEKKDIQLNPKSDNMNSNKKVDNEKSNEIVKGNKNQNNKTDDKNQNQKLNDKDQNQKQYEDQNQKLNDKKLNAQNQRKKSNDQILLNKSDAKNLNQISDKNQNLIPDNKKQNDGPNDEYSNRKSDDRNQSKQQDQDLNHKPNQHQKFNDKNQNQKSDDKTLKNNEKPDKKEIVDDNKNNGSNSNNNVNANSQVKQPQQSKIKIIPGKISFLYFPEYLKQKQIHPSYIQKFNVSLEFILKSVQKTQTYLNEFHLNDQLAVVALCSPTSSGNMVIYLWAPIQNVCDEKQSHFFFKKYLDYIENQTTFKSIMYCGQEIPELKSQGFQYQKDRNYLRRRILQMKREDFEFEYFFSMEATNISFLQTSTQSLLYSDQITPFSQSNSWCNSAILKANPNSLFEQFKDEWKIDVAIKSIHEANALLQKNSYDTFEVGEERIQFQNINMSRSMITKVPKYGFIANQGFMIVVGKTLTFPESKKKVSRMALINDVNLYFGSEFKTVEQMALTVQKSKQKAKQQESKFAFKMFSKQLYGKYLLNDDKLETDKAYYCNWDLNFAWRDQIPGKIMHDLASIKHKYGTQKFILVVEMKGEIALGAEILQEDFLY